jgi:superfamily II DNA or RNA helicase
MGLGLLRKAMDHRAGMSLASYDRLFPSQDFLPVNAKGGFRFGNLIALPLHGGSRAAGTTLFCDSDTWQPFPDQFAYLSEMKRLSPLRVEELASQMGAVQAGPVLAESAMPARPRRSELGRAPATVHAVGGAMLRIATTGLPPQLLAALKHAAAFHNPEFYRKQKQRFSTFNTPRLIRCFDDTGPDWLGLPRGLLDQATALIAAAGGTLSVTDDLPSHKPIDVTFTGTLTPVQSEAVEAMSGQATGVLSAPTGSGKTVMACALIARHGLPTAVVVNRAELLAQWRQRLGEFLDLGGKPIGTLAAGRDRRSHTVDVIMMQSLYRRDDQASVLDDYGLVIVDECHCVGAPASEAAIRAAAVGRWIGLTATPFRADSMDPIITMQLGPIRHEIADHNPLTKRLVVHSTSFITAEPLTDGASIQAMYGELAADAARNALIGAGIADAYRRGRRILALTNRVENLERLRAGLAAHGVPTLRLYGGLPAVERDTIREALSAPTGEPLVVLAIDKVAGEGLDADLDTLFLLAPVSFKGRVIQQVGRIMRTGRPDKTDVEVHDYLDAEVPMLQRMHHKRRRLLEKRGFTTGGTTSPVVTENNCNIHAAPVTRQTTTPGPSATAAQVRAWARGQGLEVPGRGKLRTELWDAYYCAHPIP